MFFQRNSDDTFGGFRLQYQQWVPSGPDSRVFYKDMHVVFDGQREYKTINLLEAMNDLRKIGEYRDNEKFKPRTLLNKIFTFMQKYGPLTERLTRKDGIESVDFTPIYTEIAKFYGHWNEFKRIRNKPAIYAKPDDYAAVMVDSGLHDQYPDIIMNGKRVNKGLANGLDYVEDDEYVCLERKMTGANIFNEFSDRAFRYGSPEALQAARILALRDLQARLIEKAGPLRLNINYVVNMPGELISAPIAIDAENLLQAIYIYFLASLDEPNARICVDCGRVFLTGPGKGRSDKTRCGRSCRPSAKNRHKK